MQRFFRHETEADRYRREGVKIGEGSKLYSVAIDGCFKHLITIGKNCIITHCTILAHDASTQGFLGYTKLARVIIGDNCYVGYQSIIRPGVHVGNNVIIGAGAVVTRDIPSNSVACGVPARVIGTYEDFVEKNRKLFEDSPELISNVLFSQKTEEQKQVQAELLADGKFGWDL